MPETEEQRWQRIQSEREEALNDKWHDEHDPPCMTCGRPVAMDGWQVGFGMYQCDRCHSEQKR